MYSGVKLRLQDIPKVPTSIHPSNTKKKLTSSESENTEMATSASLCCFMFLGVFGFVSAGEI